MSQLRRRAPRSTGQRGAALTMALAFMIVGSLVVAALIGYTMVSLRTATSYRDVTERVQAASDAVDLTITDIRYDHNKGVDGSATVTATYESATAACDAEAGSGVAGPIGGYTDRTVSCVGTDIDSGRDLVRTRVQIIDMNGEEPGAEVQVLERRVSD